MTTETPTLTSDATTEAWLRHAAVTGDRNAFAALYQRHRPTVYRYLVRRLNSDPHLAEDLTHETFTRAYTRIGSYREMGRPFVAWLLAIAGNLVIDYYKSAWRRLQVPFGDISASADAEHNELCWQTDREDVASTVAGRDYQRHLRALLSEAMAELTTLQRDVMRLRYLEGLSVRDTALKLDTNEGAVKAATYRAIRALTRNAHLRGLWADPQ